MANIEMHFQTYASANLVTIACETKENIYTVDVYQSGAVSPRINYRNVTQQEMERYAYGRAAYAKAMELRDSIIAMLYTQDTNGTDSEEYRSQWWTIKDAVRQGEMK